jgi:hypothetical protein
MRDFSLALDAIKIIGRGREEFYDSSLDEAGEEGRRRSAKSCCQL